jgi:hypothetical protein
MYALCEYRRNAVQLWRRLTLRTHRTRLHHFLLGATWPARDILHSYVRDVLMEMKPGERETLYLILDETRLTKCGRHVARADWYYDPVTQRKERSQLVLISMVWFRGFLLPWDFFVHAKRGTVPAREFEKMTEAAARMIREFLPPANVRVVVLFDSYYLCRSVVRAVRERGWLFVSQAPENRNVFLGRRKHKAGKRARQMLRNERGRKVRIGQRRYRFVSEDADMKGLGRVRLVYSRPVGRRGRRKVFVSNDLAHSGETILWHYYRRWTIEVFIKECKQTLGLGDCSSSRSDAAVTHLLLVGLAAALLTHRDVRVRGAQGQNAQGKLFLRSSYRTLQNALRHEVLRDHLRRILAAPTSRQAKHILRAWTELEAA